MKRVLIITLALMIASAGPVFSRNLTMEEALKLARENSHRLRQANADIEAASEMADAARAEWWPTVSLVARSTYISSVPTLDINIPPVVSLSREMGTNDDYQADLRVTAPLFTGGRISGGVAKADFAADYRQYLRESELDLVAYDTRIAYLNLLKAIHYSEVAVASHKRAQNMINDVTSLHDAGVADSVSLLEAKLALSKAELAMKQAKTGIRAAEVNLNRLLGLPPNTQLNPVTAADEPDPQSQNSAELSPADPRQLAASSLVDMATAELRRSKAGHWPTLMAFGGYSYGKPNLDRFNDRWNDYFTAGLNLNWSFSLGGSTQHRVSSARAQIRVVEAGYDELTRNLKQAADLARVQLELQYEQYQTAKQETLIARETFRLSGLKHKAGALSTSQLIDAEARVTASEAARAAALINYHIAVTSYEHATDPGSLREVSK